MSMANSLEVRAPILDYQVTEFAATLPSEQKFKDGTKKYLLKKVFEPFIPDDLLHRKKMGFSTPLDSWFRGELAPLMKSTVIDATSGIADIFDMRNVGEAWEQHQRGTHQHGIILWSMLMYQLWYNRYANTSTKA